MEWVDSDGIEYTHWTTALGESIGNRAFFGSNRERGFRPPDVPLTVTDQPQVFLTERPAGNVIQPHFHEMPQYQIMFEGGGRIGKHPVEPITVHYTDAYTPYGPIVAGERGLSFYTMRGKTSNGGAHYMPASRARLVRKAGRALTAHAAVGRRAPARSTTVEELIPLTADGVHAQLCSLGPGASARVEATALNGGRFLLVVGGSLVHEGRPFSRRSCIHLAPDDPAPELTAGDDGAQVLALQFAPYAN
ncbi:MAG TPA: hypothetical protein VK009_14630 [Chloroflexota bacterium]|nr:hypothetical protein [Chloroflexota bacterium]